MMAHFLLHCKCTSTNQVDATTVLICGHKSSIKRAQHDNNTTVSIGYAPTLLQAHSIQTDRGHLAQVRDSTMVFQ